MRRRSQLDFLELMDSCNLVLGTFLEICLDKAVLVNSFLSDSIYIGPINSRLALGSLGNMLGFGSKYQLGEKCSPVICFGSS